MVLPSQLPVTIGPGPGFHFMTSSHVGAILVLPEGADREDLMTKEDFRIYAERNAARWYEYAKVTRRRAIPPNSLYLVTGCDKAKSWGLAAYRETAREVKCSLKLQATLAADVSGAYNYKWEKHDSVEGRVVGDTTLPRLRNQCVFVRGFTISFKQGFVFKTRIGVTVTDQEGAKFRTKFDSSDSIPPDSGGRGSPLLPRGSSLNEAHDCAEEAEGKLVEHFEITSLSEPSYVSRSECWIGSS